jgi:hypothetical protein
LEEEGGHEPGEGGAVEFFHADVEGFLKGAAARETVAELLAWDGRMGVKDV